MCRTKHTHVHRHLSNGIVAQIFWVTFSINCRALNEYFPFVLLRIFCGKPKTARAAQQFHDTSWLHTKWFTVIAVAHIHTHDVLKLKVTSLHKFRKVSTIKCVCICVYCNTICCCTKRFWRPNKRWCSSHFHISISCTNFNCIYEVKVLTTEWCRKWVLHMMCI